MVSAPAVAARARYSNQVNSPLTQFGPNVQMNDDSNPPLPQDETAVAYNVYRPRIAVGARANLVLLDLEREWQVREDVFRSRSRNSWLLGETLAGSIATTVAGGAVVYE